MKYYFLALCFLFISHSIQAMTMEQQRQFQQSSDLFDQAVKGKTSVIESALESHQLLKKTLGPHPLLEVRIGSLTCMKAGKAWMPWNRMKLVEIGLHIIDRSLKQLSKTTYELPHEGIKTEALVRLTAAITFASVPKFLNRFGDSSRLFNVIEKKYNLSTTPKSFQAAYWFNRAQLAHKENLKNTYIKYLNNTIQVDGSGYYGQQAKKLLEK